MGLLNVSSARVRLFLRRYLNLYGTALTTGVNSERVSTSRNDDARVT